MSRGRNQLLTWLNTLLQAEYTSIQQLSDCIAYCQLVELLHPNSIVMTKLNFNTRYPDDCLRNARVLQDSLKKLKLTQTANFQKIGKGKFQDNIIFVQWLYAYTKKVEQQMERGKQEGDQSQYSIIEEMAHQYSAFERRIQLLRKQGKSGAIEDMSSHLVPNQVFMDRELERGGQGYGNQDYQDQQKYEESARYPREGYWHHQDKNYSLQPAIHPIVNQRALNQQNSIPITHNISESQIQTRCIQKLQQQFKYQVSQQQQPERYSQPKSKQCHDLKLQQLTEYINTLQFDLKNRMQANWRLMHGLDKSIEERNTLFSLLQDIEKVALEEGQSVIQNEILMVLYDRPQGFL